MNEYVNKLQIIVKDTEIRKVCFKKKMLMISLCLDLRSLRLTTRFFPRWIVKKLVVEIDSCQIVGVFYN